MESPVVPLEIAAEHYRDGMVRGKTAGIAEEQLRIIALLKSKGLYDAVLAIKNNSKRENNNGI
jgi:hypothetical protein